MKLAVYGKDGIGNLILSVFFIFLSVFNPHQSSAFEQQSFNTSSEELTARYIEEVPLEERKLYDQVMSEMITSIYISEASIYTVVSSMKAHMAIYKERLSPRDLSRQESYIKILESVLTELRQKNNETALVIIGLGQRLALADHKESSADIIKSKIEERRKMLSSNFGDQVKTNQEVSSIGYYLPPKIIESNPNLLSKFFTINQGLTSPFFEKADKKDLKIRLEIIFKQNPNGIDPIVESSITIDVSPQVIKDLNKNFQKK